MSTPTIGLQSLPWEYDVFLSFRGVDTRKTFTGHLYSALHHAKIRTFIDDEELKKGEYLAPEFTRAIQSSRISMIILSKNYPSSKWCLEELVQILECKEKGKQLVFPIFYGVDPSEVRNQREVYGMALTEHEKKIEGNKIQKWKDALTKVGNMSGWHLQGIASECESKFIDEIINKVKSVVKRVPMYVSNYVVGLESQVEHVVRSMWGEEDNSVRMIGIYGVDGMGKTTLVQVLYNKFFGYFERICFLEISSEVSAIRILQERFLRKLLNRDINVDSVGEGMMTIKNWLQTKKCLIVLDNLEDIDQFKALCGERDWFGAGSRIILTTRDAQLLNELEKGEQYEIKALDRGQSLQLFSHHAFKWCFLLKEDYTEILDDMVAYCEGIPLALEVIGASLYNKSKEEWMDTFEKLKKIPNKKVITKLKISFDELPDDNIKSLFLDLVCFSREVSMETIDSLGYFSHNEIQGLVDKCLIKLMGCRISMHSLIQKMGREIICLESPKNPGERSRLWCSNDIHDVLNGRHKGTEKIEMIVLNSSRENREYKYNTKAFKDMKNLRFLQIDGIHLEGNFKHLPRKTLICLQWNQCPLKYIPSGYLFEKLVKLEMQWSNIKEFGAPLKYFPCLESLDLGGCKYLTRTPNFSGAKNLRKLSFMECSSLEKVHSSIGDLRMLVELDLSYCERLKKLPKKFWHWQLRSAEDPSSSVCYSSKIKELGENSGMLTSLRILNLHRTNIHNLPANTTSHLLKPPKSIPNLWRSFFQNDHLKLIPQFPPNLKHISLYKCKNLKVVSATFPTCLERIFLYGCTNLKMLLELPQNLQSLSAINCESLETVYLPKMLKYVNLTHCKKLKEIQGWENAQFLTGIELRGVPNIKLSEIINKVLKVSKLNSNIEFEGYLPNNETLSWIKFEENGSSISFQWPPLISNLEFLGICIWVGLLWLNAKDCYKYYGTIEKDGFTVWSRSWYSLLIGVQVELLEEGEDVVSFVDFIPQDCFIDIKAREIFKVILEVRAVGNVNKGWVKKIRAEALYRDRENGFLQFVPITKLESNTEERRK
ncbi:PREDICTED: TMV resistance protein N-like [Ipomoea nil]|uniref:TMV resistance protein N-like n=1 Tax=Ipomoea nil TaxID=35883 RepID=UPI000900A374|nr:PREDICTED: TMV resistance protein N-like [Ipomoea nil]